MIRFFSFLVLLYSSLFSVDYDLTNFDDRQSAIKEIKKVIIKEEQIVNAYEEYILENYSVPTIANLLTNSFLGTSFLSNLDLTNFNTITIDTSILSRLSYSLKSTLSDDPFLKNLYDGNTFRKNTFYADNKINMIVQDDFAKHLLYLISKQPTGITDCTILSTKYCRSGDEIYIYDSTLRTNLLMYYNKDRFKTGPIIITDDTTLQVNNQEFDFIPKGALLYDEEGNKYVKTIDSIEKLR